MSVVDLFRGQGVIEVIALKLLFCFVRLYHDGHRLVPLVYRLGFRVPDFHGRGKGQAS